MTDTTPTPHQAVLDLMIERTDNAKFIPHWRDVFKVDTHEHIGENWLMADFGRDYDGKSYIIVTDHLHASEAGEFTRGAKEDAELVCRLLNNHYRAIAEKAQLERWNRQNK